MSRLVAKILCGIIMFVAMPICFLLPVKMVKIVTRYGARGQFYLDLLTCFAGGVFLSSYLVFMAPVVRVLIEKCVMEPNHITYPLPDMLIGLGFFIMLALDKLVNFINSKNQKKFSSSRAKGDVPRPRHTSTSSQLSSRQSGARLVNEESEIEMEDGTFTDEQQQQPSSVSVRQTKVMNGGYSENLTRHQSVLSIAVASQESTARSIIMMMALSIDSVLEGMTIGLKQTEFQVWTIFIGIIVHEMVIAFCLGLQLVRVNPNRLCPVILSCIVYTLMNPIGVIISTAIYETMENDPRVEIANGVLQALTSGCFIYVIFYEILEGQVTQATPVSKILAIFVGYIFLSVFAAIPDDSTHMVCSTSAASSFDNSTSGGNETSTSFPFDNSTSAASLFSNATSNAFPFGNATSAGFP